MKSRDFNDLLTSIDQAKEIHAGKRRSSRVFRFDPLMVKHTRRKLHVSQSRFAQLIGVSIDTLQNWEQGRRRPEGPALALLKVVDAAPETVLQVLHS